MPIKCPKCHSENTATSRFCSECGAKLIPKVDIHLSPTETVEVPKEELTTGATFANRYQIIEELGKGGMGNVYKAIDTEVQEKIALKLIKPEIAADKKTIERFRGELKLARKISHKNVCRMYDLNKEEATYYITMEFVSGENLKSFIRRAKQLTIGTALSIAKQVCEGLAEAHSLGVVHRDLKPQNIMVDTEGNARIMDFGIARSLKAHGITDAGVIIGTPEYMSPEQVEGKEADQRSDIYSLGIILYEMLTGQVPFEGDTPLSIAVKHKIESPKDPVVYNAQIPEDLSRIILRCMEKNKGKRYQNTKELLSDLENAEKRLTTAERILPRKKREKHKKIKINWKNAIVYSGVVLLLVILGWVGFNLTSKPGIMIDSIAVLPFIIETENPEIEYLSDGITESLINKLSQVSHLTVISRYSVFHYKGKSPDIQKVGQELDVKAVLAGRIVERTDGLTISVELVDTKKDRVIWGEQYPKKKMTDVISVQEAISKEIAEKLKLQLTGEEKQRLAKRYTGNTEAYDSYLKGRFYWNKRTEEGMKKGLDYFYKAIEIDPGYALAYAGLADSYNLLSRYSYLSPEEAMPKGIAAAKKALEIDNMLGEAYTSLAFAKRYYEYDWDAAEEEFKKAIKFNPGYATAHHWYAIHLSGLEKHEEATEEIKIALKLDPLSIIINTNVAWVYYFARQYDRAIEQFNKSLDMDPSFAVTHLRLGRAFLQKGLYKEAKEEFQKAITLSGGSTDMIAALGHALALLGNKAEAENILNQLHELSKEKYVSSYELAMIYIGLGQKKTALDWLEKAYTERCQYIVYLRTDPRLDSLRSDPRFQALLKKMKLK
jgi:serine/threonine protein kinase/tetratricopeptide (TPR) repeat protein